jgi:uncharacterized protein YcaQ
MPSLMFRSMAGSTRALFHGDRESLRIRRGSSAVAVERIAGGSRLSHNSTGVTLDDLRRYAVARNLFKPITLSRAIERLGFVQADPIRAPARAQDLTLRHRVRNYRAGDLERKYRALDADEDMFVNYGFVSREVHSLMHPRQKLPPPDAPARTRRHQLLAYVRANGEVHPRDDDRHFAHGTVTNYWGGSSNATTHLLDDLQYRGWLRVTRRDRGVRVYAVRDQGSTLEGLTPRERVDRLADVVIRIYAPLPALSLAFVLRRLRYAVPQFRKLIPAAILRARDRLAQATVDGVDWYWPADERIADGDDGTVRLLAPFDPIVWDRRRFEIFWGWPYRFEAYTPAPKRKYGYYALPLLWRTRMIGWANLSIVDGALRADPGFVESAPRDRTFPRELAAELERVRIFLGLR